jgi:LPXTG-motif cell wall-anchored protein
MRGHPYFGIGLALFGTLMLTPDALFMRLSGMDGIQMVGWRGLLMGAVMLAVWALSSRDRGADLRALVSAGGLLIVACQFFNATCFSLGISMAPVAVVLFAVATVPVWAALLARVFLREPTRRSTWLTIAAVLAGIGIAVFGGKGEAVSLNRDALIGAALGLGVALVLALNFVVLRARPGLPILLVIGSGALLAGIMGWTVTGPAAMPEGTIWAIAITGIAILPVSFFTLSLAARYTHASNVSLLMLLETVLGPVWVWLGTGEAPTAAMLLGGVVVVVSLGLYLWRARRRALSAVAG